MASVGINSFFRQKKKGEATTKNPSSKRISGKSPAPFSISDDGFIAVHRLDSAADLQGDEKVALAAHDEERLRQFDLDMRYGPCLGLSRMERWDRASAMGLDPPAEVEAILLRSPSALGCLWEGRV